MESRESGSEFKQDGNRLDCVFPDVVRCIYHSCCNSTLMLRSERWLRKRSNSERTPEQFFSISLFLTLAHGMEGRENGWNLFLKIAAVRTVCFPMVCDESAVPV